MNARAILLLLTGFLYYNVAYAETRDHTMFRQSGLPIPRFVSLNCDEINLRVGPGRDYPIQRVYLRNDYPIKVIEEFGLWRRVKDHEGETGWMFHRLLSGQKTAMVIGTEDAFLHQSASPKSHILAALEPGLIVELEYCELLHCQIRYQEREGWLERSRLWGAQ